MIRRAAMTCAIGLSLAATPVFAIMALLAMGHGSNYPGTHHAIEQAAWMMNDMSGMYVLMSVFHLASWLKLIAVPGLPGRMVLQERKAEA